MGFDEIIDNIEDKVEDAVGDVVEKVNEIREDVADKIEEAGEKIGDAISQNAKEDYSSTKKSYDDWQSQNQNKSVDEVKKSAQEHGYSLEFDDSGNIDWQNTNATNYASMTSDRDGSEKSAFGLENMSKNFAEWLRGGPNQVSCTELVEIKGEITDVETKLDAIIKDFDGKVLNQINLFYADLGANIGKWEGDTQVKAVAIAELFKIYLDNIKYFYESLKTHVQVLEQDTDSFYGNSVQVKNLDSTSH